MRWMAAVLLVCAACGGDENGGRRRYLAGEWDFALLTPGGLTYSCGSDGQFTTGIMAIDEDEAGNLTGQWDLCGASWADDDLRGHASGFGGFHLSFLDGAIGVVAGTASASMLHGLARGLEDGSKFIATRRGSNQSGGNGKVPPAW